MGKLLGASVIGNLMLAVCAYFLFHSNNTLNTKVGERDSAIIGHVKQEKKLEGVVLQCNTARVDEITRHNLQIVSLKRESDARLAEIAKAIGALRQERGVLEMNLRNIQMPDRVAGAQQRIDAINRMVDAYIVDLQKTQQVAQ